MIIGEATYVPPIDVEDSISDRFYDLRKKFLDNFVYGEEDHILTRFDLIHDLGTISFKNEGDENPKTIDLIGVGRDIAQRDMLLVNLKANLCETKTINFSLTEGHKYAVEGIAGLGKTTLLNEFGYCGATDLQQLREHPLYGVLMGQSEDNLCFRHIARMQLAQGQRIIDRSQFLSGMVYGAYARGHCFIYLDEPQRKFITESEEFETVVLTPNCSLHKVAQRIKHRGKMDQHVTFDYTVLTFALFNILAMNFNLPIVPVFHFELACQAERRAKKEEMKKEEVEHL